MAKLKQKKNDRRIFLILTSNICVSNITSIVVIQKLQNQKPQSKTNISKHLFHLIWSFTKTIEFDNVKVPKKI